MTDPSKGYRVLPFPAARKVVVDSGNLAARRHVIHGLVEIDVTRPRQVMRQHKEQTGESLSFTAFIVACLGQAVAQNPSVQAYRNWRNQLIVYDHVDVVTEIETEVGGVALPHVIRAANRKTFYEIHSEIRGLQNNPARSAQTGMVRLGQKAPGFLRGLFYWALRLNPHWLVGISGTVIVTSVGMFGKGGGWGIGFLPIHTLGLTVGGIAVKPGVVDGRIEIREYLDLTISFDHDVVDGAPAARFAKGLVSLIENAPMLDDIVRSDPSTTPFP